MDRLLHLEGCPWPAEMVVESDPTAAGAVVVVMAAGQLEPGLEPDQVQAAAEVAVVMQPVVGWSLLGQQVEEHQ
jgi:hypothetical protein